MLSRMQAILSIRNGVQTLYDRGKFELVKEILGDVHPDNFSSVSDRDVHNMWLEIVAAIARQED